MELIHEYIGHMYGPYFLVFYGVMTLLAFLVIKLVALRLDKTDPSQSPKIEMELDPYTIAYIRNGPREVAKLILMSLIERKYLAVNSGKDLLRIKKVHPPEENLTEMELCVYKLYKNAQSIGTSLDKGSVLSFITSVMKQEKVIVENPDFFNSDKDKWVLDGVKMGAFLVLIFLALYKMITAYNSGHHNIGFLILECIISGLFVFALVALPWKSRKGVQFIKDLELIYQPKQKNNPAHHDILSNQLLLASIFGLGLSEAGYAYLDTRPGGVFTTSGSCGSSCGSSCGGGGCGGGGCGGCGG